MKRWCLVLLTLSACESDAPPSATLRGTLSLEVLDRADVVIEPRGEGSVVTLTPTLGFGLLADGQAIQGEGRIEPLPETTDTLYTARLSSPPVDGGPCGGESVSLAFSLHRPGDNALVVGGLSAYCGADTWYGVPARVLRLAGPLPLP